MTGDMHVTRWLQRADLLDRPAEDAFEIADFTARPVDVGIIQQFEGDTASQGGPKIREGWLVAENARQQKNPRWPVAHDSAPNTERSSSSRVGWLCVHASAK